MYTYILYISITFMYTNIPLALNPHISLKSSEYLPLIII